MSTAWVIHDVRGIKVSWRTRREYKKYREDSWSIMEGMR